MHYLKANTSVKVVIGPFVDVTDGFTPEAGVTLGAADEAELIKHDSASVVDISSNTWAAITSADGYYNLTLTVTDVNTEGMMTILIQDDSVCLPVRATFMVLAEAAYDSLFTAKDTGYMDINVKAISEDTTAADNAELAFDGTGYGFTGCTMPTTTTLTGHTAQTGDTYALANGANGFANIKTDTTAILVDTSTTLDDHLTDIKGTGFIKDTNSLVDFPLASNYSAARAGYLDNLNISENVAGTSEISALNDVSAAQVNAEVVDALTTDTYAEPGQGAPGATVSLKDKIGYLYKFMRNKIVTDSTTIEIYDDAGTTVDQKSTISDDGTDFTRGEFTTGP